MHQRVKHISAHFNKQLFILVVFNISVFSQSFFIAKLDFFDSWPLGLYLDHFIQTNLDFNLSFFITLGNEKSNKLASSNWVYRSQLLWSIRALLRTGKNISINLLTFLPLTKIFAKPYLWNLITMS